MDTYLESDADATGRYERKALGCSPQFPSQWEVTNYPNNFSMHDKVGANWKDSFSLKKRECKPPRKD